MQKKSKKSLLSFVVIILLLSLSFFFVGCNQKDNSSPSTSTQPSIPSTPDITPPNPPNTQANLFQEITDWLQANVQPKGDNYIFSLYDNPTINYASNLIFNRKEDALYLTGNENSLREVNLKIPHLKEYSSFQGYEISANFTLNTKTLYGFLTLPIHKFSSMEDSIPLPNFEHIADPDNPNVPPTDDETMQFRTALSDKLNNLLAEFNKFYIEKIKASDPKYNGAIFKYFYLPVMLKN